MLPSLLLLSVSLQLAWTCLPMKPAEDMHCPSVPLASAVDGYAVNGLVKTIVNGAEVYSCAPPGKADLIEVDGGKITPVPGGKITCNPNSGIFVDDQNMAVNQKTYNCGAKADCQEKCGMNIGTVYTDNGINKYLSPPGDFNPTCVYICPQDYNVIVNNKRHDRVLCHMITGAYTADSVDGEMLSETNKFLCQGCGCSTDPTVLNDGQRGLCRTNKLCVAPVKTQACESFCPTDSVALYKDKDGKPQTSPTIKCLGTDWIAEGYDQQAGITCQFADGKGYNEVQPMGGILAPCKKLEVLMPCANCDATQIIYVEDPDGGTTVMCKMGTLITDTATNPEEDDLKHRCFFASDFQFAEVNCVKDDTQVTMCMTGVDATKIGWNCSFGVCRVMCKDTNLMLSYDVGNGVQKSEFLKCFTGDLQDLDGISVIDKTMVTCV